jgi:putative ABC transport system ATP-binding protein
VSFQLTRVSFRYSREDPLVLDDVSAKLRHGEVVAILGPSGCGKSTLLHLLALLWEGKLAHGQMSKHDLAAGEVEYDDGQERRNYRDVHRNPQLRAWLRREYFGVVLQNCYLLPHFSCLENVCMPLALQGWDKKDQEEWATKLIQTVDDKGKIKNQKENKGTEDRTEKRNGNDLSDIVRKRKPPRSVSLGQKQRFAVLRALVHLPRVIFADEPTSNLDPNNTRTILNMLLEWQRGTLYEECLKEFMIAGRDPPQGLSRSGEGNRTLVLVCHNFETVKDRTDRVLIIGDDHRLESFESTVDPTAPSKNKRIWPVELEEKLKALRLSETQPTD